MKKRVIASLLLSALLLSLCPATFAAQPVGEIGQAAVIDPSEAELSLQTEESAPIGYNPGQTGTSVYKIQALAEVQDAGDGITWSLSNGVLTISGTGDMSEFDSLSDMPWGDSLGSIHTVVVEAGVTSLPRYAFYGCSALASVSIASTVSSIGDGAFAKCSALTSVTLPDSIKTLSSGLFADCISLSSVTAPGAQVISDYAFQRCPISIFEVGKNVTEISGLAFFGADITAFTVADGNTTYSARDGVLYTDGEKTLCFYPKGSDARSFVIPEGVTRIGQGAFLRAFNLDQVTIPNTVTEIESSAFQHAGITEVTIPDSVTTVGDFAFFGCSAVTVTFGRGLAETSYQMFRECPKLTTIHFPDTPLSLYAHTFAFCPSLTEVVLPDTVYEIESACFGECTSLKTFVGNGLTKIPYQAFLNCRSLTDITIDRVETISRFTFYGCSSLTEVTLPESTRYVHSMAFPESVRLICKNPEVSKFGTNGLARIQTVSITGYDDYTAAYAVLELVNAERAKEGLKALTMDGELLACAMQRAAETSILFSHTRTDSSHINEMNRKIWGENIAAGQASPEAVMDSWMHSQGHRENILTEDYTSIGIGCFKIGGRYYWVQNFSTEAAVPTDKPTDRTVTNQVRLALDSFSEAIITSGIIFGSSETYKIDIMVDLGAQRLQAGESTKATAVVTANAHFGAPVQIDSTGCVWTSADPTVAAVDGTGAVTALKEGRTKIELTLGIAHAYALLAVGNAPLTQFVDVPDNAYYTDAVDWAVENDITTGLDATHFAPGNGCTRGQIVTFLWRAAGQPTPRSTDNPFVDVSADAFYYTAVLWAVEKGITTGVDATHFSPTGSCTRGQIVTFLWRTAGEPFTWVGDVNYSFTDVRADSFYYEAMLWAVANGITTGVDATHFKPSGPCVRGQAVTFLWRAQNLMD